MVLHLKRAGARELGSSGQPSTSGDSHHHLSDDDLSFLIRCALRAFVAVFLQVLLNIFATPCYCPNKPLSLSISSNVAVCACHCCYLYKPFKQRCVLLSFLPHSDMPCLHALLLSGSLDKTHSNAAMPNCRFINPTYLSENAWSKIQEKFKEDGSVQLKVRGVRVNWLLVSVEVIVLNGVLI
eukprot:scaffold151480_cov32-Tisochrysis_lutea.AAC.3